MSRLKTIEQKIKIFLVNHSLSYYFYKIFKLFKNKKKGNYFGEFGEDILINRFFRKKNDGFYVDIGCYHPIKGSLTYYLYKKGWRGLNVDLSKVSIDLFKLARPKDHNVQAAVTDFDGETHFFENGMINQQNTLENNGTNLKKTIIAYPSIPEQEQIISQIEQGFTLIENSQRIVNSTLQTLETMRMSVLKQAFQGKLVPQDPNDEPASVLLERIKKEKLKIRQ